MNYGNDTYNVVKIGTQWWMAENLKTAIYNDLTDIPNVTDDTWGSLTTGAWSYYNNNTSNGNTYGKLYNWYSVNTGKLCPQDWSVPSSNTNWATLIDYLGGTSVAGGKLKQTGTTLWNSPNTGATNESGFNALPAGTRESNTILFNDDISDLYLWLGDINNDITINILDIFLLIYIII